MPWWSPPDRLDACAARVIALLCSLAVLAGYLGSLVSQTISPAADEFGASNNAQGIVLAITRVGVVVAVAITFLADRRGRRPMLVFSGYAASVFAITTAVAPSLWAYGASQTLARGLSTALALLIGVVAAEETPARSRAYVVSILALCAGLGSGMVVWFLPLADLGESAWRLLFLIPAVGVVVVAMVARSLPETRRFEAALPGGRRHVARNRLVLLAATAFFASAFAAPASNFLNDFLREDRGFSNSRVSVFQLTVNTPIGIGVLVGGRLADLPRAPGDRRDRLLDRRGVGRGPVQHGWCDNVARGHHRNDRRRRRHPCARRLFLRAVRYIAPGPVEWPPDRGGRGR